MPPRIETLIEDADTFEIVGDQIAAILAVETAGQVALAEAAHKNPKLWGLQVFRERSTPWEEWLDAPGKDTIGDDRHLPIVNVRYDTDKVDESASNIVERQKHTATYHIDCFGYGKAAGTETGHIAGDHAAANECHRAVRLVRKIIMSGHYVYLGSPRRDQQFVWKRLIVSRTVFQPQIAGRAIQHILGARLSLQVEFSEFSPQVQGYPLELIAVTFKRETGEVLLNASFGLTPISAEVTPNGLQILLTYRAPLNPGSVEAPAAFKVTGPSAEPLVNSVAVDGPTVTLGVDAAILKDEPVLLDYLPGAAPIQFVGGNPVSDLHEYQVANNSTA